MDEWTLNDLLECSVCLERLDTSSKVLPCQHTFCKTCLEEILTTHRELRCPECRILVESSIEDLPPNVLLMRILESMKNSGNPGGEKKKVGGSGGGGSNNFQKQEGGTVTGTPDGGSPHQPSHNNVEHSKIQSGHKHFQNPLPMVPYAIAMYDYTSQEAGDLHFKKGAVILLNRKVDDHWYEGQLDGLIGIFPVNYVQVVKPLPEQAPTCRALYNFRIANEDDEGQSLTFKKNDVIAVIRRVDENWGEGRLNDRIGIFPLAFVELNHAAEALMEKSVNSQPGPSRVAPPAPATEDAVPLLISDDSSQSSKLNLPVLSSPSTTTSSFSVTPTSSSSTSSTSNSAPNSPPSIQPPSNPSNPFLPQSPRQRFLQTSHITKVLHGVLQTSHIVEQPIFSSRQEIINVPLPGQSGELSAFASTKGKRHSFSALTPTPHNGSNSTSISNKHPGDKSNVESGSNNVNGRLSRHGSQRHRRSGSDYVVTTREFDRYVALYSYKPQKADELELQKGGFYHVTEFCQDGWFKGISLSTLQTGVFPGNYVTLAKKLPIVFPPTAHACPPPCRPRSVQQVKTIKHQRQQEQQHVQPQLEQEQLQPPQQPLQQQQPQLIVPPELPPRVPSPFARQAKSSSQNSSLFWNTRPEDNVSSSRQKAFFDVCSIGYQPETKPKRPGLSATSAVVGTPTKTTEKAKDKKEKSGLIKRLTTIKRSKSPPASSTSYSMDNPVFDDAPAADAASVSSSFVQAMMQSQPVHSRSGSCPSQLIHVPEIGTNHRILSASVSARMKHRERPSVSNASFTHSTSRMESSIPGSAIPPPPGSSHRKSNSLDAGEVRKPRQLVPPIRERFRCIVPYPPNSEYELELKVGDIIYVHKKREDGWYKGTQQRTGRTGLFPASFVETY